MHQDWDGVEYLILSKNIREKKCSYLIHQIYIVEAFMKCYMVNIALPEEYTPEFLSLIPSQRAYINKLMGRGVVSTYTLSLDRTTLWVTMFGDSSVDIEAYLDRFPMKDFMDFEIVEAMFHHNAAHYVFPMSLN